MSVRRTKIDGESALIAKVGDNLWKVVRSDGSVLFLVPDAQTRDYSPDEPRVVAKDSDWDESKHPRGEGGKFATVGHESLTGQEQQSIYYYARQAYHGLNRNLRLGLPLSEKQEEWKRDLDSALQKSTLAENTTVYRGFNNMELIRGMKEGEVLSNGAYTSTSPDAKTATSFKDFSEGLLEISLSAGTRALDVGRVSSMENEILLPRDTSLRYVGRGEPIGVGQSPARTYKFELVPQAAIDWNPDEPRVPAGEPGGGQWRGENLSASERAEVYAYTGEAHSSINSDLRLGVLGDDTERSIALLDSAIEKSALTSDTVVYRGVGASGFYKMLDALQPGEAITDAAYVSTSGSLTSAAMFSGGSISGGSVMEIRLPAGSRALYVEEFSANKGVEEDEYILPRGTTFTYVTSRTTKGGRKIYTFDLAPRAATDSDWDESKHPRDDKGRWVGEVGPDRSIISLESLQKEEQDRRARAAKIVTKLSSKLTAEEKVAVRDYTKEKTYEEMNQRLRRGEEGGSNTLDSAIAKSVFTEDVLLFRGVIGDFAASLASLKIGDVLTDHGYLSTSMDPGYPSEFGKVMVISVKKGQTGLRLGGLSRKKEEEVLLPRGTQLRFAGVGRQGRYRFDVVSVGATDWNPFQPRVPAGQHGGGEWAGGAGTGQLSLNTNKKLGLEPTHVDALKQYTASIYYPVNKALRAKPQGEMTSMEQAVVRALDEAFDRSQRTTEPMQLFRAAGEEFASVVDRLKVGDDVVDPAFASTTIDEQYARTLLSGQPGSNKALIEIVLPKDSRAIDTSPFNPFKGENETLLPRNTTFRYLGKERDVFRFRANPRPIAA